MALRTRFHPFTPYVTPRPPAGTYDPALDAARRAASRGLHDTTQDVGLAGERAGQDFTFGVGQADQTLGYQKADYGAHVAALQRSYDVLAGQQQEQQAGAGVLQGGAVLQAAAKRAANQGLQQTALDTGLARDVTAHDQTVAQLGVGQTRGITDRATTLARATREDTNFGLDTRGQEAFQAAGTGYTPPAPGTPGGRPANEGPGGHRTIVRGGVAYVVAPNGQVLSHRRVRR